MCLPSLVTIQWLCEIFGLSLGQFFSDSEQPAPMAANGETMALLALFESLQKDERQFVVETLKRFCRLSAKRRRS